MTIFTIRNARPNYRSGPISARPFALTLRAVDRDAINELREYFHAHGYRCSNADVLRWGVELLLAAKTRQEAEEARPSEATDARCPVD